MLAKRVLVSLLLFKGTAMLLSFLWTCNDYHAAFQGDEDLAIFAKLSSSSHTTTTTTSGIMDDSSSKRYHHHQYHHDHAIPNVVIFTHYINLLDYNSNNNNSNGKNATISSISSSRDSQEILELQALQQNIRDIIALHRNATVRFLTDHDCEQSIRMALMAVGNNNDNKATRLVEYFRQESRGMYKSDICRGAALWETGGLYFDVDLGVRMPVWAILGTHTAFVTSKVHERSKQRPGFFQAFMGATPRHPILQRYLELFIQYYDGNLKLETRLLKKEHKHMLGVRILHVAYDQLLLEEEEEEIRTTKLIQNNPIVTVQPPPPERSLTSSSAWKQQQHKMGHVELWQEVLYTPQKFPYVPEPTWGTEKACKYVVVANKGWPPAVPFYSRVEGSRMCPPQEQIR